MVTRPLPPCPDCGTTLHRDGRAGYATAEPGTVVHAARGRCGPCYRRHIRGGTRRRPPVEVTAPKAWVEQALCTKVDPELFFATPGEWHITRAAKGVCSACPVTAECLQYALDNDEGYGVWGGLTTNQRDRLQRQRTA